MATFMNFRKEEENTQTDIRFDVNTALRRNGFRHDLDALEAEKMLSDKPVYTYVLRPNSLHRGFAISFVQKNGSIKHDHFTLIDHIYGIWRNGQFHHVGKLEKVICDMMECSVYDLKPLSS